MKVLVTGSTGLLGRALVPRFQKKAEVLGVSASGREGSRACDLRNESAVRGLFENGNWDLVIHAAAYSDVDGCERSPELAHASNALATRHLAALCGDRRIPFIYISTDYVFDGRNSVPYTEEDPVFPVNIYGLTKLEGECYTRQFAAPAAIVRTSWLFGSGVARNFVSAVTERLKREEVVGVLEDQVDCATYTEDLAAAIEKIGQRLCEWVPSEGRAACEVFHICNSGATTRYEMTLELRKLLDRSRVRIEKISPETIQGRLAVRPKHSVMCTTRFEKLFQIKMRSWQEALHDFFKGA